MWAIVPVAGFELLNTPSAFNPLRYKHIVFVGLVLVAILETPWVKRRLQGRSVSLSALLLVAMVAFMYLAVFGSMLLDA